MNQAFLVNADAGAPAELARFSGRPVFLGVRPEHFVPKAATDSAGHCVEATVETVGKTGADAIVCLATAGHRLVARLTAETMVTPGQRLCMTFDFRQAHFFDPQTGARLK